MEKCNCISEIKEGLENHYGAKEEIEKVTDVSLENTALMFGNGPSTIQLYSELKIEYDYRNKKGELKHKKEKANMGYKYCPFCGNPYEEESKTESN